jgi:putative spermidine/putrescine transport system ATP-binding protein
LGPSGCGKTTALRILAGFEQADQGSVTVAGEDITKVPTPLRKFGMVFQDYSLFPNMTATANIEFPLRIAKVGQAERQRAVRDLLELTDLGDHATKFPHQLSGGQRQRVALARALASNPRVLLLDEPLSALDAKVRESLRDEIRRVQREFGVTTLFVTHDQHEALAIADRVAVMREGGLEQLGSPRDLYERPATPFVAGFVGAGNRLSAQREGDQWRVLNRLVGGSGTAAVSALVLVRPEQIALDLDDESEFRVSEISFLGALSRVTVTSPELSVVADLLTADAGAYRVGTGVRLRLRDDVTSVAVLN